MPPPDREMRPWLSPTLNAPRLPPVFPSLKRVQRKSGTTETVVRTEPEATKHSDMDTFMSEGSSEGSHSDPAPPIPEKSVFRGVFQNQQSFMPHVEPRTEIDHKRPGSSREENDGSLLWPKPEMTKSRLVTPEPPSLQHTAPSTSPVLIARTSKRVSIEKKRQARCSEDARLVEEAKRRTVGLIHQAHQTLEEEEHSLETTLRQNVSMIRQIRRIEKTTAARASVIRGGLQPRSSISEKRPEWHVSRGRTLERGDSRRRSLVLTDPPRSHQGGKDPAPVLAKGKAVAPASKSLKSYASGQIRVPATRPTSKLTSKVATSNVKNPVVPKQSSVAIPRLRTTQEKAVRRTVESPVKKYIESKKPTVTSHKKRESAPSPEDLMVVTDGQKSMLEPETSTTHKHLDDDCDALGSPFGSSLLRTDPFRPSKETERSTGLVSPVESVNRNSSDSWVAPVYRPKTRGDHENEHPPARPRPIQSVPKPATKAEIKRRELSPIFTGLEEPMERGRPRTRATVLPPRTAEARKEKRSKRVPTEDRTSMVSEHPTVVSSNHSDRSLIFSEELSLSPNLHELHDPEKSIHDYVMDYVSRGEKSTMTETSHGEMHAEQMSPIDLTKVSALHMTSPPVAKPSHAEWQRRPSNCGIFSHDEDIGGPIELGADCRETLRKSIEADKDDPEVTSRLDEQKKSLIDFHSRIGDQAPRVSLDSTFKAVDISFGFQPDNNSRSSRSPIAERRHPGDRHHRKGIQNVQWHSDLPLRLKSESPLRDNTNKSSKTAVDMNFGKYETTDFDTLLRSRVTQDLSDASSYPELQHQSKFPLSCLTNSHRGRKMHVSFASGEEDGLFANSAVIDSGAKNEMSNHASTVDCSKHGDSGNRENHKFAGPAPVEGGNEITDSSRKTDEAKSSTARVYHPGDYEKAKRGLRNAIEAGNLLIEHSEQREDAGGIANPTPSYDQVHDAVNFILDVKSRFFYQPEIYDKFIRLLETCHRESITSEQAKYIDAEVAKLFVDSPALLEGFNQFRPSGKNSSAKEQPSESASVGTSRPAVVTSEAQDDNTGRSGSQANSAMSLRVTERELNAENERQSETYRRLVESLRKSARVLGQEPGHRPAQTRSTVPRMKKEQPKFNPAAPEFRPLMDTFAPLPPNPIWPQLTKIPELTTPNLSYNNQIHNGRLGNKYGPIYAPSEARVVMNAKGYHTMPNRTNRGLVALKADLAAAEDPQSTVLKAPLTMNGTTYYTMPKQEVSVNATSLSRGSGNKYENPCQIGFSKPVVPTYSASVRSVPRKPQFGRNNHTDPLWMYTPLVPIRKGSASEPMARGKDPSEGPGIETKRLDDYVAKMKLDDFMSRFPMTGRRAQVVPNMKQKYAAEIQHRLELVLYEKKEKEAAARKLSGMLPGIPSVLKV